MRAVQAQFSYHNHRTWYKVKLIVIYVLLVNDLLINSAADHDNMDEIVPDNTMDYFLYVYDCSRLRCGLRAPLLKRIVPTPLHPPPSSSSSVLLCWHNK